VRGDYGVGMVHTFVDAPALSVAATQVALASKMLQSEACEQNGKQYQFMSPACTHLPLLPQSVFEAQVFWHQ
jgi:hypothetical protein